MRTSSLTPGFVAVAMALAAACGSSSTQSRSGSLDADAGDDASPTFDGSFTPDGSGTSSGGSSGDGGGGDGGSLDGGSGEGGVSLSRFPFPRVVYQGGALISAPTIVTVTFSGDSLASNLATLGASIASGVYWDSIRAGYCGGGSCVGDGPAGTAIALTSTPAAHYTDSAQGGPSTLQTALEGLVSGNELPAPDGNTIYALYFPSSTTIDLDGAKSCQAFGGYHNTALVGGYEVAYAVIDECAAPLSMPPITVLQNTTISASHEFIEAASDPDPAPGFYLDLSDPATWGWDQVLGGEIADLCADPFGLGQDETIAGGATVQRIWSLDHASAGKNPCVPIPAGEVYFNAFSRDSVVVMDVGQTKTVEVDALADGTIGPWTVSAQDWTDKSAIATFLGFSIQGGLNSDAGPEIQVKSGDRLQLQVTLLADPAAAGYPSADAVVVSAYGTGNTATAAHVWPFLVMTTAAAADAGVQTMRPVRHARAHRIPRDSP